MFINQLCDPNTKPQVSSSYVMIAGYCGLHLQGLEDLIEHKRKVFKGLLGFVASNSAHTRAMAQYFVKLMAEDPQYKLFVPQGLEPILKYFEECDNVKKILGKYGDEVAKFSALVQDSTNHLVHSQVSKTEPNEPVGNGFAVLVSTQIDSYGEFMHKPFIETLKEITQEIITKLRNDNFYLGERDDYWMKELQRRENHGELNIQMPLTEQSGDEERNYQRKVLPWEQFELEKRSNDGRKRNEIIMVASLIDRVPNLAGLTRTCEIMNAKALVIGNKAVVKSAEFESIAVTAQKWLPIYEV